jgi:hypothetical protein
MNEILHRTSQPALMDVVNPKTANPRSIVFSSLKITSHIGDQVAILVLSLFPLPYATILMS